MVQVSFAFQLSKVVARVLVFVVRGFVAAMSHLPPLPLTPLTPFTSHVISTPLTTPAILAAPAILSILASLPLWRTNLGTMPRQKRKPQPPMVYNALAPLLVRACSWRTHHG